MYSKNMSSRAGKKRLREVQSSSTPSTSTVHRSSIRRRLNPVHVKPLPAVVPAPSHSATPPVSTFNFQFTNDLRKALDELGEAAPPSKTSMPGDIRLSSVDEDLEDVLVNHQASGKVGKEDSPCIRLISR